MGIKDSRKSKRDHCVLTEDTEVGSIYNITERVKQIKKLYELSKCLNKDYQVFTNKLSKSTFKTDELIKIGIETGTRLAFIDDNNNPIVIFTKDDLKK